MTRIYSNLTIEIKTKTHKHFLYSFLDKMKIKRQTTTWVLDLRHKVSKTYAVLKLNIRYASGEHLRSARIYFWEFSRQLMERILTCTVLSEKLEMSSHILTLFAVIPLHSKVPISASSKLLNFIKCTLCLNIDLSSSAR